MDYMHESTYKDKKLSYLLLFLLLLLSKFFAFRGFSWGNGMDVVMYGIIAMCLGFYSYKKNNRTVSVHSNVYRMSVLVLLMFVCSILTGLFIGGQSPYYSIRGLLSSYYVGLLVFFFLLGKEISIEQVEKTLIVLFLLYFIVYLFSILFQDAYLFGVISEDKVETMEADRENRGVYRFAIPYENIITLLLFYAINKQSSMNNSKLFILFLIVLTVLRGTRMAVAATFLVAILLYLKVNKKSVSKILLVIVSVLFLGYVAFMYTGLSSVVENMLEITQREVSEGEENIRSAEALYYFTGYNKTITEDVFGHGVPVEGTFASDMEKMTLYDFWLEDVGYADLFAQFGIVGLSIVLLLLISVIRTPIYDNHLYAKYFFVYIMLTTITGQAFLQNMALVAICLFIIEKSHLKKNKEQYE